MELENSTSEQVSPGATSEDSSVVDQPQDTPVSDSGEALKETAQTTPLTEQPEKDWKGEYENLNKNYTELRRKLNAQGQEKNEYKTRFQSLESQQKQIADALASLIHQETYNPDKFMEEFRTQGPNYIKNLLQKERDNLLREPAEKIQTLEQRLVKYEADSALKDRRANTAAYPDFAELEPEMNEIYLNNKELFDQNFPDLDSKIDALYNATRLRHSQDALKQAAALGRKKSEDELVREAHAGVTSGGRSGAQAPPNLQAMNSSQLKEYFRNKGMVEE